MPSSTEDQAIATLPSPRELKTLVGLDGFAESVVERGRSEIKEAILGAGPRHVVIVGPCSIHDETAALEYATWLKAMSDEVSESLILVMRAYFEKPRTSIGWKGFINDPHLDGSGRMPEGILRARKLLREIARLGVPCACELLDPLVVPYLSDLISWGAIGARTAESQTHRELASGAPFPIGFKNPTTGHVEGAADAVLAARQAHRCLGCSDDGRIVVQETPGNPAVHIVLRGSKLGPNYRPAEIREACEELRARNLPERLIIDAAHGNSGKQALGQCVVVESLAAQIVEGNSALRGTMIESNLVGGQQTLQGGAVLTYGQSITDPCADLGATEDMLRLLAKANRTVMFHKRCAS